jgi:hypothetical protein
MLSFRGRFSVLYNDTQISFYSLLSIHAFLVDTEKWKVVSTGIFQTSRSLYIQASVEKKYISKDCAKETKMRNDASMLL